MDTYYVIMVAFVIALVVIFTGATYKNDIVNSASTSSLEKIFFWLIGLTVMVLFTFAFNVIFYIQVRNKEGPQGNTGPRGYSGYVYVNEN